MLTLQTIKAKQDEINNMISAFENQPKTAILISGRTIDLMPGEHYAGTILGKNNESDYDLILLPDDKDDINWKNAVEWAKEQGGELPNRREQALLYANLKEQFEERYYWSREQHASDSDYAWCQSFGYGLQYCSVKDSEFRARAVRRLIINSVI